MELRANADRRTQGPYAVAATLIEALVPDADEKLVSAHDIEIRAVAPDLRVPVHRPESVAAKLPAAERILIPAARRTLRIANGLAEFVRDHLDLAGPLALHVTNLSESDRTDREFLAVLRRRVRPRTLTIVPAAAEPYEQMSPQEHDERAAQLEHAGLARPRRGAIPYHRERGEHPELALAALTAALEECVTEGFHHAAVDLGERALLLADPDTGEAAWWRVVHRTANAFAATEREDAARALFDEGRRRSADSRNRATAAYATAMLLIRHHDPDRRDPEEALAWINEAIAITSLLPDPRQRAFHLGFDLNGKALIELRRGRLEEAARLVQEAIDLADRDLTPWEHPIHRLILRVNRAHLAARLGDTSSALADLDAAIAADPGYPDHYIDRGNLLHRLGRDEEAVADYERAMRVGLPFPEPYYNRAEVRFGAGDHRGALADLDYALELDPGFADAYANRAGLWVRFGEYGKARLDCQAGLALDPRNAYLLCVLGQVEAVEGRHGEARKAYDAALDHDPTAAAAWASRGILMYETGHLEAAVADLTRALELEETATLRFNRAVALRDLGRERMARLDLERAAELDPADDDVRQALATL